jgi:hypothetical protein
MHINQSQRWIAMALFFFFFFVIAETFLGLQFLIKQVRANLMQMSRNAWARFLMHPSDSLIIEQCRPYYESYRIKYVLARIAFFLNDKVKLI